LVLEGEEEGQNSLKFKSLVLHVIDVKLSCFQEGDDCQEDPVEVEKKEELGEEANSENMRAIDMPVDCTSVDCTQ